MRPNSANFNRARRKYRPRKIRLLLIAESPPSSGGFFYFPMTIGKDHLFRETMKALDLWPKNDPMRRGVNKQSMLRRFQSMGLYLLDTCDFPVNQLRLVERRETVLQQIPRLVKDVINLDPPHILILKSSIFQPVITALKESGFRSRVLNSGPVPFPSHGNQRIYRSLLRRALVKTHSLSWRACFGPVTFPSGRWLRCGYVARPQ